MVAKSAEYRAFAKGLLKTALQQGMTAAQLESRLSDLVTRSRPMTKKAQTPWDPSQTAKNVADVARTGADFTLTRILPLIGATSLGAGYLLPQMTDISEQEAQDEIKTRDLLQTYARQTELARHNAAAGRYARQRRATPPSGRRL